MTRNELEERANALKIKFPANIGDEKLADKIAAAEAEQADAKTGGSANGADETASVHGGASTGAGGAAVATPPETTPAADEDVVTPPEPDTATARDIDQEAWDTLDDDVAYAVNCAVKSGRRRAGRRWPGGVTHVRKGELSFAQFSELMADPMFGLKPAEIAVSA